MKRSVGDLKHSFFVLKTESGYKVKASFLADLKGSIYRASTRKLAEDYIKCLKNGTPPKQ